MRRIEETSRFRRDFRREKRGIHSGYLDRLLESTVHMLANDLPLARRSFDHPLSGEWRDFRDCHLRGDLVLIYPKSVIIPCNLSASVRIANWVFERSRNSS
jgi:mRNA interferase YafQ